MTGVWVVSLGDCAKQVLETQPQYSPAHVLLGWIDLTDKTRTQRAANSIKSFETALQSSTGRDIEALLGKAKYLEQHRQATEALEVLTMVIAEFSWFHPALTEKATVLLSVAHWEEAAQTATRAIKQDPNDIEALGILALYQLAREGNAQVAIDRLKRLTEAVDKYEPKNAELYYRLARPLGRLAGGAMDVQKLTLAMVERARTLQPENSDYITEAATQLLLCGNVSDAGKTYQLAMKINESNVLALHGSIRCQLLGGNLEDAKAQLEFQLEIQMSIGKSALLVHLTALAAAAEGAERSEVMRLSREAAALHERAYADKPMGFDFFVAYDAPFVLEQAQQYLQYCSSEPLGRSEPPSDELSAALQLLESATQTVPGCLDCLLAEARAKYLVNDGDEARRTLNTVLRLNPSFVDAHILLARIHMHAEEYREASGALEQALSHSFSIGESPQYNLIKAEIHQKQGEHDEALRVLNRVMAMPGVKRATPASSSSGSGAGTPVSIHERASVYLQLVVAHEKLGQKHEASTMMQSALTEFKGTAEEHFVTIANATLSLEREDPEAALSLLQTVPSDAPYYVKANTTMAHIYMQYRHNKRLYVKCYKQLAEKRPTKYTRLLLGDAYMRVQEPELAIAVYKQALDDADSGDASLASKIGRALVTTHDYGEAITYYTHAVEKDPQRASLRHDLANLYIRLKNLDKAEIVLQAALDQSGRQSDTATLIDNVKAYILLAQVHHESAEEKPESAKKAVELLLQARELQNRVLSKSRTEHADFIRAQRQAAADICHQLAQFHNTGEQAQAERAQSFYNEALRHDDGHEASILALAKLYLARGELDPCQHQCIQLLRIDPSNEDANRNKIGHHRVAHNRADNPAALFMPHIRNTPPRFTHAIP